MAIASPDIRNYASGKGSAFMRKAGETDWRHIGNCPKFEFTPAVEKLEHFSSMEGLKTKDRTEILSKAGTLDITLEEITMENLNIALLGDDITNGSGGDQEFNIFASNAVRCEVKFVGNNQVGARYEVYFPQVDFIPSSAIPFISDEWMAIDIQGEVAAVNGSFGTIRKVRDGQ